MKGIELKDKPGIDTVRSTNAKGYMEVEEEVISKVKKKN